MEKLKVGIIFGGASSEREVSLESGRHLYQNVDPSRFTATPLFLSGAREIWKIPIKLVVMNTTTDIEQQLEATAQRIPYEDLRGQFDFILNGLHGKYGEDGCMQGLLELLGIPYSGSGVMTSAIGMNKDITRRIVAEAGIKTPRYILVRRNQWETSREAALMSIAAMGFPLVVKPIAEGCSTAVTKIHESDQIASAIEDALQWDPVCMVDEFIDGTEITTTIMGNSHPTSMPLTETPPSLHDAVLSLEDKFLPGGAKMITPARIAPGQTRAFQEQMVQAYTALMIRGYARIDGFIRGGEFIFNEVNTLPGATPSTCIIQQAAHVGMTPMDLVSKIIDLGLEAHAHKIGPLV
ncbi:D-alanine--D-alanine ligase [Candidatus Uhrbacteria bacterium]|nr:D-alanine--D-alanine ligase [Candidatus Uhrbacteria bacterium]